MRKSKITRKSTDLILKTFPTRNVLLAQIVIPFNGCMFRTKQLSVDEGGGSRCVSLLMYNVSFFTKLSPSSFMQCIGMLTLQIHYMNYISRIDKCLESIFFIRSSII